MANTLEEKVVLIGGGAKNLGGLLARSLAEDGANIVVHYNSDSSAGAAKETAAAVEAHGREAMVVQGDFTRAENVERVFEAAVERFGGIDYAVNTVGKVLKKPILAVTEEEYDVMAAVNAKTAFFFLQQAGKHLNENGAIVTIVTSLLAGYTGYYSTYAGGKAPVEHFTRAASKEFADRGISVTAVGPGPMDTPFFYAQETEEAVAYLKAAAAIGSRSKTGLTDIEDIVPTVKHLLTDGWWITGQTIFSNGGFTTR